MKAIKKIIILLAVILLSAANICGQENLQVAEYQVNEDGCVIFRPIGDTIHCTINFNGASNTPLYENPAPLSSFKGGKLPMSVSTSASGAAIVNIPIDIYSTANGFQPSVNLTYNNNNQNGYATDILGRGWDLSCFSQISRVGKTKYYDNQTEEVKARVNFNMDLTVINGNEAFSLDGNRLIILSNNYPSSVTYQTETGNIKIIGHLNGIFPYINNRYAYDYFEVYYPNGKKAIYGHDERSVKALSFQLISETDLKGEQITYAYKYNTLYRGNDTINNILLDSITYGKSREAVVKFRYGQVFIENNCFNTRGEDMIKGIDIKLNNKLLRSYSMEYHYIFNKAMLESVGCTGANGDKLSPIYLGYNDEKYNIEPTINAHLEYYYPFTDASQLRAVRGKFKYHYDNEGLMVFPNKKSYNIGISNYFNNYFYTNNYTGNEDIVIKTDLKSNNTVLLKTGERFVDLLSADLDGGVGEEIVKINESGIDSINFKVFTANTDGTLTEKYTRVFRVSNIEPNEEGIPENVYCPKQFIVGDFNGDGKDEVLMATYTAKGNPQINNNYYIVYKNVYLFDIENDSIIYNRPLITNTPNPPFMEYVTPTTPPDPPLDVLYSEKIVPIDYDGDKKADLCWIKNSETSVYTFGTENDSLLLKNVDNYNGLKAENLFLGNLENMGEIYSGDFNGDGKTDFMKNGYVYVSTGTGSFIYCSYPELEGKTNILATQDMNNDGLTDIVLYEEVGDSIIISTKYLYDGEIYPEDAGFKIEKNRIFIPGNPLKKHYNQSLLCLSGPNIRSISSVYDMERARLLTKVYDSYRNRTIIEYGRLTDTNKGIDGKLYIDEGEYSFPYCNYLDNATVVSSINTYANGVKISGTAYQYKNAANHLQGLGFCGFEQVLEHDLLRNKTTTRILDPLNFGVLKNQDSPIETSSNTYNVTVAPNRIATINLTKQIITDKLRNTTVTKNITSYDSYGNALREVTEYGNGLSKIQTNTYSYTNSDTVFSILPKSQTETNILNNDSVNSKIEVAYNMRGLPVSKATYYNNNLVSQDTCLYNNQYQLAELKTRKYAAAFLSTKYEYDTYGRLTKVTDPMGLYQTYTYNVSGLNENVKDYKGNKIVNTYDSFGRKIKETRPDGTVTQSTLSWSTDVQGALYVVTTTATGIPTTKTWYNSLGYEVRTAQKRFDGTDLKVDKQYDIYGRLYKTSQPFKTTASLWDVYEYDTYDRPVKITYASGKTDVWAYSENIITSTIEGVTTTKTYNAKGDLISSANQGGTATYSLRPDGQPDSITAGGLVTTFGYDNYGRQTSINDPSAGLETLVYDPNGNIQSRTDANGKTISMIYDGYNRVTTKSSPEFTTAYLYNTDGLLASETTTNGTTTEYTYDNLRRISSMKEMVPDGKWVKRLFTYSLGKLIKTNYTFSSQSSSLTEYAVYKNGYLFESGLEKDVLPFLDLNNSGTTGLTSKALTTNLIGTYIPPTIEIIGGVDSRDQIRTPFWKLETENNMGQPTKSITGSVTREYGYDTYGLPALRKAYTGSNVFQNQTYSFDISTGNLYARNNIKYNTTETFGYDNLNRLININNSLGLQSTIYGSNGNIEVQSGVGQLAYNHPNKPYALTDAATGGTAIPMRNQDITYTSFKRPASITENGYTAQFTYNAEGDRVKMQIQNNGNNTLTRYYTANYEQDVTPNGTTERLYVGGDAYSAPAVLIKNAANTWKIHYICRDYLGSITQLTDSTGTVVQELDYDAWGRLRNPQTQTVYAPGSEPALLLGRGYTGHEHLTQFGFINMNARLYDPAVGRFLSPDPYIQDPENSQSYNRYSYCLNNPLKYTDLSGEKRKSYTYNWYTGQYEDENGDWASWKDAYSWMNSNWMFANRSDFSGGNNGWNVGDSYDPGYTYFNSGTGQIRFLAKNNLGGALLKTFNPTGNFSTLADRLESMGFLDRTSTTLGVGEFIYTGLEKLTSNSKFWIDSKGQIRPTSLLERGANGKFIRGVQGLRNSQALAAKAAGIYNVAGKVVGGLGIAVTGYDMINNGVNLSNSLDMVFSTAGFLPGAGWIVSSSYFITNTVIELSTGKDIGEHITDFVK